MMWPVAAQAQPVDDNFWTARGLFDPRGGPRDALREHGIDVNGRITHFYQGVVSGDGRRQWQSGAKIEASGRIDMGKLGLWPGLSINIQQEWNIGSDALKQGAGVLLPVNTAMGLPRLGGYENDLSINITQRFNDSFSISAGKFNMLTLAAGTPLVGGGGVDTFMNLGAAAPVSGVTPPYLIGAMATLRTDPAIFTLMVYDPRNAQDPKVLQRPFRDGVTTSLSVTVPTRYFFGLQGFYGVRGAYSTQSGFDLDQLPALALPPQSRGALQKKGYVFGSVSFQQNFWEDPTNPARAWGVFFEAALSDGNPNPFRWHILTGLAGSVPFASRPLDRWGIAFFHYGLSDELKDGLRRLGIRRRDETGVEAFYSFAVTPWLKVSGNLQWIRPTEPDKKDAMFAGLRTQVRF